MTVQLKMRASLYGREQVFVHNVVSIRCDGRRVRFMNSARSCVNISLRLIASMTLLEEGVA
jgi:hypothetical protein